MSRSGAGYLGSSDFQPHIPIQGTSGMLWNSLHSSRWALHLMLMPSRIKHSGWLESHPPLVQLNFIPFTTSVSEHPFPPPLECSGYSAKYPLVSHSGCSVTTFLILEHQEGQGSKHMGIPPLESCPPCPDIRNVSWVLHHSLQGLNLAAVFTVGGLQVQYVAWLHLTKGKDGDRQ